MIPVQETAPGVVSMEAQTDARSSRDHEQVTGKHRSFVTPAQAGVQKSQAKLDSRLRGNDIKDLKDPLFSSLVESWKTKGVTYACTDL
ncbi:MAG: hypothetical protein MUC98_15390 [Desulfobacterota bacterium]|jgi:hypothetical protein|nr:hypothetical protein [Thermodesulfobacteriota bacterium]